MNAKQLFFERYRGFQEYPDVLVAGLTDAQLRASPHPSANPIAWTLWHIARCEDVGINRLLVDRVQVWTGGDWASRLAVAVPHVGTGMGKDEVRDLSRRVDLAELQAYRTAVAARTTDVVDELPLHDLSTELRIAQLERVFVDEGAGGEVAGKIVEAYAGRSKGWLLGHLILTHQYYHIGQAYLTRAMHGAPTPW